jgi:signal transduction histidine kinase
LVPDGGFYEIAGFADDRGSRIFVNGEHILDTGMPSESAAGNIPEERFLRFTARPKDGVIEIVQQSSNFVFRSNTSHTRWTIGSPEIVGRWAVGFVNSYAFNMGIYLTLFFAHMLLFLVMRSYRANLWFALFCFLWTVRTGITGTRPLAELFWQLGWSFFLRVEYLTLVLAPVLLALAYKIIFPGIIPKWLRIFTYAAAGIFSVFYLFADTLLMSHTMLFFEIIAVFIGAAGIFSMIYRLRKPDTKQKIIIASSFVLLISLILDSLYYNKIRLPFMHNAIAESALVIFFLFQMSAMFLGTVEEFAAAEKAKQKLAVENAALDRMNRMKNELISTVAHETRTPLAVLSGYAELISMELRRKNIDEQTAADLDKIADETQRIAGLMDEMQKFVRDKDDAISKTRLKFGGVLDGVARLYRPILERKNTRLTLNIPENLPDVYADANAVTQVLFNLLQNSRNHTENGEVNVEAFSKVNFIVVTVSDTGSGIQPDLLPRLFERGVTGGSGSGIGLSICKEIIDAHSGVIEITSEPNKGAAAMFTLPVFDERNEDNSRT